MQTLSHAKLLLGFQLSAQCHVQSGAAMVLMAALSTSLKIASLRPELQRFSLQNKAFFTPYLEGQISNCIFKGMVGCLACPRDTTGSGGGGPSCITIRTEAVRRGCCWLKLPPGTSYLGLTVCLMLIRWAHTVHGLTNRIYCLSRS